MDLGGTWVAAPGGGGAVLGFPDEGFDDADWVTVEVPGHWGRVAGLADASSVRYRRRFNQQAPAAGERRWLVLEGVLYQGDVWLNGGYLGDVEGYFMAHQFEVTEAMAGRGEHLLALEVSCPARSSDISGGHTLGSLGQASELLPPGNPGGVWGPVRVVSTGSVRILDLRVATVGASEQRAVVTLQADLDAADAGLVWLHTSIGEIDHVGDHVLAAGLNQVEWRVVVPRPRRWWPHQLGDQPQYEVSVEARTGDGRLSDRRQVRTGLREVRMDRWQFSVNGVRLFLKGTSFGPASPWWAEVDEADMRRDVELAKDAGLDLIRVFGHVAPPALYDAADEAGMLIWQDLPLIGPFPRGSREAITDCARAAVCTVGAHPSVILWCGHVDPFGDNAGERGGNVPGTARRGPGRAPEAGSGETGLSLARQLAVHQRPSWNLSVLDRSVKRELERRDPSRPVVAYSGVLPHLPRLDGTDTHLWLGWKRGNERDLEQLAARWPKAVRFVSQFGAQSPPADLTSISPVDSTSPDDSDAEGSPQAWLDSHWPNLDWAGLARDHGFDAAAMNRHVPPRDHTSPAEWQEAAWAYQAMLVRRHIETLRRLKYRPAGGFCHHFFADSHPAVSTALLDWQRWPKPAYDALAKACQPVIVVADRLPTELTPGTELEIGVHVVSDRQEPVVGLQVEATLEWPGDRQTWTWTGAVGSDECVLVGTLTWRVPNASGPTSLHLHLSGPTQATNRYDAVIFG